MPPSLSAARIVERLDARGFHHIVTVPDFVQLSVHELIDSSPGFQVVRCSDENQAIHVAGGLHIGGKKVAVLMQNQGLLNCLNSLRAVGLDAGLPMLLMIGQFGREFANVGQDPSLSRRRVVNLVEPVLDVLGIEHWRLDAPQDMPNIDRAMAACTAASRPAAVLIGHYTAWNQP